MQDKLSGNNLGYMHEVNGQEAAPPELVELQILSV